MLKIRSVPHIELIPVEKLLKTLPRFKEMKDSNGYVGLIGDVLYEHAKLTEPRCLNLNVPYSYIARTGKALSRLELLTGITGERARQTMVSLRKAILEDTTIANRLQTMSPYNEMGWYSAAQRPGVLSIGRYRIEVNGEYMGIDTLYDDILPAVIRKRTASADRIHVLTDIKTRYRISEVITDPVSVIDKAIDNVHS